MLDKIQFEKRRVSPTPPSQEKEMLNVDVRSKISVRKAQKVVIAGGLCTPKFVPYHTGFVRKFGPQVYLELVDMAKQGSEPNKLLSWLLKDEETDYGKA